MKNRLTKSVLFLLFFSVLVYFFVKSDRNHSWAKSFPEDIENSVANCGLVFVKKESISANNIELPVRKKMQLGIQKILSKVGLMPYPHEFGWHVAYQDTMQNTQISFKAWCLGDHVKGIEIWSDSKSKACLNPKISKTFENYTIIWHTK